MKCLVFCDKSHDIYMNLLTSYSVPDLEIARAYICGEAYESSVDIEMFPLSSITEKQSFDTALVFLSDSVSVKKLLDMVYENTDYTILNQYNFTESCLSGAGQLELLRLDLCQKCPSDYNLIMGDFSYYTSLSIKDEICDGSVRVQVGKFCSIGPDITLFLAVEHKNNWNTTYPFYHLLNLQTTEHSSVATKGDIIIGNDVWIGGDVTILSGVEIGDGCIIGAHAVVSKNVEPYSVIVGNPGRVVKKRFSQDRIEKLMEMRWWDWNYQMIYAAMDMLQSEDIESLYTFWKNNT